MSHTPSRIKGQPYPGAMQASPRLTGFFTFLIFSMFSSSKASRSLSKLQNLQNHCELNDVECMQSVLKSFPLRDLVALDTAIQNSQVDSSSSSYQRSAVIRESEGVSIGLSQRHGRHDSVQRRQRHLLMDTSLDPAQKIVSVRSHAPDFHPSMVGGADPGTLQPLFQPSLEGYYPYMGYETATPQCKRILNRYLGKCMFKNGDSSGGGQRFQQVSLHDNNAGRKSGKAHSIDDGVISGKATEHGAPALRGGDEDFRKSMDFAEAIADSGTEDYR